MIHPPTASSATRRVIQKNMHRICHVTKAKVLDQLHNQECPRGMTGEGQNEVEMVIQNTCEKREQAKQGTADHRASRQNCDMNVEGRELLMTKPDGHQIEQKIKNDYEISRDVGEQAQVIFKNVLAAETHLAVEKFPNAGARIQGTDLSARPAGSVNADEAADAADRTMAELA